MLVFCNKAIVFMAPNSKFDRISHIDCLMGTLHNASQRNVVFKKVVYIAKQMVPSPQKASMGNLPFGERAAVLCETSFKISE